MKLYLSVEIRGRSILGRTIKSKRPAEMLGV